MTTPAPAGPPDIPRLLDLMERFHAESGRALDRASAERSFRRLLGNEERGGAWIASRENEPVGYVVLTVRHSMETGGPAGVIDDLFVRPGVRRSGVGSALMAALFDACRQRGIAAIQVEADSADPIASAFYRKFGLGPYTDGRHILAKRLCA